MGSEKHGECHLPATRRLTVSGFSVLYTSRRRKQRYRWDLYFKTLPNTIVAAYILPDAILLRQHYRMKSVFAECSLTHGQETGEAGWASDGGGGPCISLPHPSQSHSTFCETTRERDPQSRSGPHLSGALHHRLIPAPASLSALQCQALQVVGGHLEQPGLQHSQANSLSACSEPQRDCVGPEHLPTARQC